MAFKNAAQAVVADTDTGTAKAPLWRRWVLLLAAAVGFAALAPTAEAAFPGRNGLIAYTAPSALGESGGPAELWTVEPSSGTTTQLTVLRFTEGPAWSEDGRTLAFSAFIGRGGNIIGAVPWRRPAAAPWTDGDEEWMTVPPPPVWPDPVGYASDLDPTWAPGGRQIAYRDEAGSVIVLGADDTKRVIATGAAMDGPAWSPDGRLIAFTRCLPSAPACSLWAVRPNGTKVRQLTDGTMNERAPSWSPDGRRLVFEADTGLWTIRRRALAGRAQPQRLVESGAGPSWSPDGQQIAFGREDGVYVMGADGSDPTRIAAAPLPVRWTDWQPRVWPVRVLP